MEYITRCLQILVITSCSLWGICVAHPEFWGPLCQHSAYCAASDSEAWAQFLQAVKPNSWIQRIVHVTTGNNEDKVGLNYPWAYSSGSQSMVSISAASVSSGPC